MGSEMQTVYCVPIDESGKDIAEEEPIIELPLGNIYSQEEATNTLLRMLLNFGSISVLIIMTMIGTPIIYKFFISDIIKNEIESNIDFIKADKPKRLATSEKMASFFILFTSLLMISGFVTSNTISGMMGIFVIIVFFIGYARIQFEKMTKPSKEFYKKYLDIDNYNSTDFSKGIEFDNISQRIQWIRYKTSIYPVIFIYLIELFYLIYIYYVTQNNLNSGVLFLFLWFPFFLNTLLFKENNNNTKQNTK